MEALQKLKEAEATLYTAQEENRSRLRRDLNPFPEVESKVKHYMKPTTLTPPKLRPAVAADSPKSPPATAISPSNGAKSSPRQTTAPSSIISSIFRSGMQECIKAPADSRRAQIERERDEELARRIPSRPTSARKDKVDASPQQGDPTNPPSPSIGASEVVTKPKPTTPKGGSDRANTTAKHSPSKPADPSARRGSLKSSPSKDPEPSATASPSTLAAGAQSAAPATPPSKATKPQASPEKKASSLTGSPAEEAGSHALARRTPERKPPASSSGARATTPTAKRRASGGSKPIPDKLTPISPSEVDVPVLSPKRAPMGAKPTAGDEKHCREAIPPSTNDPSTEVQQERCGSGGTTALGKGNHEGGQADELQTTPQAEGASESAATSPPAPTPYTEVEGTANEIQTLPQAEGASEPAATSPPAPTSSADDSSPFDTEGTTVAQQG
eukprot:GGOE01021151.1.p1 GENE.GGOE01021151.1~~GGOE01021151.1.p1  ORF type:complete len:485 (-),score=71.07 GGOE01021151.1:388-1719(-)